MEKKNLNEYSEKYYDVSKDQLERINEYLATSNFSEKDLDRFEKNLERIVQIDHEIIKIVFYIIPESTPRPRSGLNGHFYVKNASSNNKFMKLVVDNEESLRGIIHTPCSFQCKLYFPIPANMNKVEKLLAEIGAIKPPTNKDWDNLGKTYSDMIQKWLLLNDSLIIKGTSEKFWSFKPRVEIIIDYLVDYDCKYNKKLIESSKVYKRDINL